MRILITGGTGFVGRNLVPRLIAKGHLVTVIGRNQEKIKKVFENRVRATTWSTFSNLAPSDFEIVINLAGENIGESRWSQKQKKAIINSRVHITRKIAEWSMQAKHLHLYSASAIGVYGLQPTSSEFPPKLTEQAPIDFNYAKDFLSEVGHQWELSLTPAIDSNVPVTIMRFGVILKRGEGMLKKLELPARLGMGAVLGTGDQIISWIDIDDLVNAILFLMDRPHLTGVINLCSPNAISQKNFTAKLAKVMNRPVFLKLPAPLIKLMFGQMGKELLLSGQYVYPERLLNEGFTFIYPTIDSTLKKEFAY